ncbi:hypothetical protein [Anaerococcus lactolyticus]|uniref:Uncharacterized protein n=1 Tax=Anaerococcus lactolyticus S7-1-13 TaxID=1284686 RepID=A0A095Z4X5_9FIRM|nr:hypothetical protein [Anaerococcus lactolyticus]KGF03549.1 hypothetical protein HMPREF1630_07025 [Anaerococcus lactolyticus S7-1-13]
MKKAFISIYVLLILLVCGLTIGFIYKENETNYDVAKSMYAKKEAMYEAESFLNIIIEEKTLDDKLNIDDLLESLKPKSEIRVRIEEAKNLVKEAKGAKVLIVTSLYKNVTAKATIAYKLDEANKIKIIYKKIY